MNPIHELKNTVAGAAVLRDWFGDGLHPVSQDQANTRAMACLHGKSGVECPHLKAPNWWNAAAQAKDHIADAIKAQLAAKGSLKLETALDKHPRMCGVCGCCASLKVWTPIKHIAAHTSEELTKKYPAYCWIRQEIENGL